MKPTEHKNDRVLTIQSALVRLEGDEDLLRAALVRFRESLTGSVAELHAVHRRSGIKALIFGARSLKEPAGGVGAETMNGLALAIESLAEPDSLDGCEKLIEAVIDQVTEVRDSIRDSLSQEEVS
jgi:hypothetical protein